MAAWPQNPLLVMTFIGVIFLVFGLQDLLSPSSRNVVSGALWIVAALLAVGTGIAQKYTLRNLALALFLLFIASGAAAVILKIVDLVRSLQQRQ